MISEAEVRAGIMPAAQAFVGQSEEYTAMAPELFQGVLEKGQAEALYVPAVKLVVDSTLGILTQPEVEARLPREVATRRKVAVHFGEYVIGVAVHSDIFRHFYTKNQSLAPLARSILGELTNPDDTKYISALCLAPFFDTSVVAGGALGFLQRREMAGQNPAEVIGRSRGLLMIAGVEKGLSGKAFDYLGAPYAGDAHYTLDERQDEPAVTFTAETRDYLHSLMTEDSGCPTGRLAEFGRPDVSLLQASWERLVNYLVPPDATVTAKPGRTGRPSPA